MQTDIIHTDTKSIEVSKVEAEEMNSVVAAKDGVLDLGIQSLELDQLPSLEDAIPIPIDLVDQYWTPETVGETKRMFFHRTEIREVPSVNNPEVLETVRFAMFIEVGKDNKKRSVCSAAARLVSFMHNRKIKQFTPFQITYKGKVNNKNNGFQSDSFEILLLNTSK